MSKQKPIMMADVRDQFFPECSPENRKRGTYDNRPVLRAFREGRIIGVPTRWRKCKDKKTGAIRQVPIDFRIERAEWKRLFREGINHPLDEESEVAV